MVYINSSYKWGYMDGHHANQTESEGRGDYSIRMHRGESRRGQGMARNFTAAWLTMTVVCK